MIKLFDKLLGFFKSPLPLFLIFLHANVCFKQILSQKWIFICFRMFLIMNKLFIAPDGDYDMVAAVTIKLYS